jgi:hypothetical protein
MKKKPSNKDKAKIKELEIALSVRDSFLSMYERLLNMQWRRSQMISDRSCARGQKTSP